MSKLLIYEVRRGLMLNVKERTAGVLQAMRGGESLQRTHGRGGVEWFLRPSGRPVSSAVANLVIGDPRIIPGADGLLDGCHQTYRLLVE